MKGANFHEKAFSKVLRGIVSTTSAPPLSNHCALPVELSRTIGHGTVQQMKNNKEILRRMSSKESANLFYMFTECLRP